MNVSSLAARKRLSLLVSLVILYFITQYGSNITKQPPVERSLSKTTYENMGIEGKRILIAVASYGTDQFLYFQDLLGSIRDLCEYGTQISVVTYSTLPFTPQTINLLNSRTRCRHPNGNIDAKVIIQGAHLKEHFVDAHRKYFYDHLDEYDLFMYTEDDQNIRPMHFISYLDETQKLKNIVGEKVNLLC